MSAACRLVTATIAFLALSLGAGVAAADEAKLVDAAALLQTFTSDDGDSIPIDLLQRAHGIAVIPDVFRGGFILGGRRGRGVLVVRSDNGEWSNPAFITLTGGSIGWQIGAESADIVLIFANDRSIPAPAAVARCAGGGFRGGPQGPPQVPPGAAAGGVPRRRRCPRPVPRWSDAGRGGQ